MLRRLIAAALTLALLAPPTFSAEPAKDKTPVKQKAPPKPRTVSTKELAKRVDKVLADSALQRGFFGIHIVDVATGKTLYEVNPDRLFTPASNTKLFTSAAAFALLGPQYKVETTVETNGVLEASGRLSGDLLLVGRGDPNLSGRVLPYQKKTERQTPHLRALEELADHLVAAGLKEIDGDIVGDDTRFAFERYGNGWGQDDLMWSDGAPASALTVNDNTVFLSITPGEIGQAAKVAVDPDISYYEIENRITTIASGKREIGMDRQPGSKRLLLWGTIAADDAGTSEALAIEDPPEYAAEAMKEMLAKRGVTVHGKVRAEHRLTAELPVYALDVDAIAQHGEHGGALSNEKPSTPPRTVLARVSSRPLADDLMVLNKVSQNLHAELALRAIGIEHGAAPSLEAALAEEATFLTSIGLDKDEFKFYDGSGMSAHNVVSPRAITKLLVWADHQPWGAQFRATLPVGGVDGSLEDRFRESVGRERVWAKTGTLTHTNALSGYAETLSGRKLVFAILVNHHRLTSGGAKKVIDHILELLLDDQTGRLAVRSTRGR